jgi:RNA polymerase sigma-70 factor (sigma-E family)
MRRAQLVIAYSDFVTQRSAALFRTAYFVLGDYQLAQDLLQEALTKTYVAWPRIRDVSKAEAYARRVIITTAISWRRRRSFHELPKDALPEVAVVDQYEELAAQDALWSQLRVLAPRQRAAVVLRYYDDLSEVQTAELMGCSVGTVKSQVSTALGRLRKQMGPDVGPHSAEDEAVPS